MGALAHAKIKQTTGEAPVPRQLNKKPPDIAER
jgi:hypothetical protein